MTEENIKKENLNGEGEIKPAEVVSGTEDAGTQVVKSPLKKNVFRDRGGAKRQKPKSEFQQKIINISRVTRVVKGGRRLSFRVDMVIGDKHGKVGIGSGKALDTSIAIEKAYNQAKKNLRKIGLTDKGSIPHMIEAKFCASRVQIMPNGSRGLVAGSTVRNVLEFAGITDVTAKVLSKSSNKLNNAKATLLAISKFAVPIVDKAEEKKEVSAVPEK